MLSHPGRYRGFVRQEDFRLVDVLDNRFGRYYANGGSKEVSARMVVAGTDRAAARERRASDATAC